jgi:hypothetical protein
VIRDWNSLAPRGWMAALLAGPAPFVLSARPLAFLVVAV